MDPHVIKSLHIQDNAFGLRLLRLVCQEIFTITNMHINKCSDVSFEVKHSTLLGNNDRRTDLVIGKFHFRRTDLVIGKFHLQ